MLGGLLQLLDLDVFPSDGKRTAVSDSVDLQADEAFWVGFENRLIGEVTNHVAVDPCLDASAIADNAVVVPRAVFEVLMWLTLVVGYKPPATGCLAVDIAAFATIAYISGFDFALRTVDAAFRCVAFRL